MQRRGTRVEQRGLEGMPGRQRGIRGIRCRDKARFVHGERRCTQRSTKGGRTRHAANTSSEAAEGVYLQMFSHHSATATELLMRGYVSVLSRFAIGKIRARPAQDQESNPSGEATRH